jgi:hypothetical protein
MTNSRYSTYQHSLILTIDSDLFEPELVIIDPDRAFTVGSLVAVQASARRENSFPLLVRVGSSRRDDKGRLDCLRRGAATVVA